MVTALPVARGEGLLARPDMLDKYEPAPIALPWEHLEKDIER